MPNHYHILLEIVDPANLSKMMAGLGRSYVYYYQKSYKLCGHIWQGRFKSQPIEKEKYLLSCARYIERNPLRAKMVSSSEKYEYSSAKFYVYGKEGNLTKIDPCFESFGSNISECRSNYADFLKIYKEEEELLFKENNEPVLGSREFKARLVYKKGRYLPRRKGRVPEYAGFVS